MPKLQVYTCRYLFFLSLLLLVSGASAQYKLFIHPADHSLAFFQDSLKLQTEFRNREACSNFLSSLPTQLQSKGFLAASVDSIELADSAATISLFAGDKYTGGFIGLSALDKKAVEQTGFNAGSFHKKALNLGQLHQLQQNILAYYENNGYPFAKLQFDSIDLSGKQFSALLKVDKGPNYHIDSIRINGNVTISNKFMQRYLNLPVGTPYQKARLENIDQRLLELPYLQQKQPWDMTMLGTGSIVNLYLQPKKSSQVNVLIGFLPTPASSDIQTSSKIVVTGEANVNLRNSLGKGELIGLNWQQLQKGSPRLNLAFEQPYIFGSAFGLSTSFDLYKKDSAYLNLNFILGVQYSLSMNETGKIFFQSLSTNLLTIDTNRVRSQRLLPEVADVRISNIGVDYDFNKTDYRFNPRRGSQAHMVFSAGTKHIKQNNAILKLSSPDFDYKSLYDTVKLSSYQVRVKIDAAHFFRLGKSTVLKTAANVGWIQSPAVYRNELFQIGGYRLLRGFDEESIYASQYGVATIEYRYLIGLNSFLFSFIDAAASANHSVYTHSSNQFIGAGIGMAFETKAGVFNISLAAGKRNDVKFNLRESKIHLGYVNYF